MKAPANKSPAVPRLGLWDTVSIIVGIIVGVGIFKAPGEVFGHVSGPWLVLGVWVLGGGLSLLGALCYAELASTYPRSGGEYVYLTRAYGSGVGYLFAWAQLAVIRTGGIAALAYVLAESAGRLWNLDAFSSILLAVVAITGLTTIHILGANPGKRTQNGLTLAKVISLGGIVVAGFCFAQPPTEVAVADASARSGSFVVAMIFVFYAYLGWNEAAYVAREVHRPQRNLPLALIMGTVAVMTIYLLVNGAYLIGLGYETARATQASAADLLNLTLGGYGGQLMDILIIVSVLGGMNGMILTGSRLFAEMGHDHRLFAPLARWHPRWGTPVNSLITQAAWCIAIVSAVALFWPGNDGFRFLLISTAPVFWLFFLLTGIALFVLRWKEPEAVRPFRVPLYPLVPLLFCGWCAYMIVGAIWEARFESGIGLGILAAGLLVYFFPVVLFRRTIAGEKLQGPHQRTRQFLNRYEPVADHHDQMQT